MHRKVQLIGCRAPPPPPPVSAMAPMSPGAGAGRRQLSPQSARRPLIGWGDNAPKMGSEYTKLRHQTRAPMTIGNEGPGDSAGEIRPQDAKWRHAAITVLGGRRLANYLQRADFGCAEHCGAPAQEAIESEQETLWRWTVEAARHAKCRFAGHDFGYRGTSLDLTLEDGADMASDWKKWRTKSQGSKNSS